MPPESLLWSGACGASMTLLVRPSPDGQHHARAEYSQLVASLSMFNGRLNRLRCVNTPAARKSLNCVGKAPVYRLRSLGERHCELPGSPPYQPVCSTGGNRPHGKCPPRRDFVTSR